MIYDGCHSQEITIHQRKTEALQESVKVLKLKIRSVRM